MNIAFQSIPVLPEMVIPRVEISIHKLFLLAGRNPLLADSVTMRNRYVVSVVLAVGLALSMSSISGSVPSAKAALRMARPVEPWLVANQFRQPLNRYGAGHRGVDVYARKHAVLVSPIAGRLTWVGWVATRHAIVVTSASGLVFEAEPACSNLAVGSEIAAGQKIAWICFSDSYVSHCPADLCAHLGLRNPDGYLSIEGFLGDLAPSRLTNSG